MFENRTLNIATLIIYLLTNQLQCYYLYSI